MDKSGREKKEEDGEESDADEPDGCWYPREPGERDTSQVGPTF